MTTPDSAPSRICRWNVRTDVVDPLSCYAVGRVVASSPGSVMYSTECGVDMALKNLVGWTVLILPRRAFKRVNI